MRTADYPRTALLHKLRNRVQGVETSVFLRGVNRRVTGVERITGKPQNHRPHFEARQTGRGATRYLTAAQTLWISSVMRWIAVLVVLLAFGALLVVWGTAWAGSRASQRIRMAVYALLVVVIVYEIGRIIAL